jgi:hypothetical protein
MREARKLILGKLEVDCVKGDDQVLVVVDLLKSTDHTRLTPNAPNKVFVRKAVMKTHSLLVNQRQIVLVDSGEVVAVEA